MFLRIISCAIIFTVSKLSIEVAGQKAVKIESKFRILAPQFICPKDENPVVEKPDTTIITLQTTSESDLHVKWTVRWTPLSPTPAQRFTLLLWRAVRELEKQLNKPPTEPNVYVIKNSELLRGVNYIFNINSVEPDGEVSEPRSFNIDNTQGDQKLMIDGRNDMLSVILVGTQTAYVDTIFVVEAQVTTCQPTQDYYFHWTVEAIGSEESVDMSRTQGSRLELPPCSLSAGLTYNVKCQVMRINSQDLITATSLPFIVQERGLEVYLNFDYLEISKDHPFTVESTVIDHNSCDTSVTFEWECTHNSEYCITEMASDNNTMFFPGLADLGEYIITLTVTGSAQTSTVNATVMVVEPVLPVIQLTPLSRVLNKHSTVSLVANATNLAPTCTISWYFASEEYLASLNSIATNDTCDDCQHGEPLSDTVTIYSLEEQFLSELTDFTNETEWRQITASLAAMGGRARFIAHCGCSLTFNCDTMGTVYADLWFKFNESPETKNLLVSPDTGTAMETVFRLSTLAAADPDTPLQYSFYCTAGDETILLASYIDHRSVETFLPYTEGGTEVWVKVCDVRGACSNGSPKKVSLAPGEARTLDTLISDASAHARRCELMLLKRVAQSASITYTNTHQTEALKKFTNNLLRSLSIMDKDSCVSRYHDEYTSLLVWLDKHGVMTNSLL